MTIQTLKVGKERLVVLRERDYKMLLSRLSSEVERERGDVAESRRRMKESGGMTLAELKKKIGK